MREEEWLKAANADIPEAGGGWDSPSGEVWAGIQAALQQRRRRRMLFWWWLGTGVTALALLAWVLHKNASVLDMPHADHVPQEVASEAIGLSDCQTVGLPDYQSNDVNLSRLLNHRVSRSSHRVTRSQNQAPWNSVETLCTSVVKKTSLELFLKLTTSDYPTVRLSASEQATELLKKTPALLENPQPAIPVVANSFIRAPRWWMGISGAYPLQADLLSAQSEIPAYAALKENLYRRRDWSLRLGIDHRRWHVFTGVGMYDLELHTLLNSRLLYDPQLERAAPDNTVESTYALSVPSGYGRIDCEVDFFRSSDRPVTPGRAVPVRIENRQQLHLVQVPLGINYRLARWGAFSANVGGGLSANWVVDRDMEIKATSRLEGLNLRRVRRLATSGNRVEPRHLSGWLEASAGWALSHRIELALHTSWHQTLTPVASYGDGNAKARHVAVGGGIYYKF